MTHASRLARRDRDFARGLSSRARRGAGRPARIFMSGRPDVPRQRRVRRSRRSTIDLRADAIEAGMAAGGFGGLAAGGSPAARRARLGFFFFLAGARPAGASPVAASGAAGASTAGAAAAESAGRSAHSRSAAAPSARPCASGASCRVRRRGASLAPRRRVAGGPARRRRRDLPCRPCSRPATRHRRDARRHAGRGSRRTSSRRRCAWPPAWRPACPVFASAALAIRLQDDSSTSTKLVVCGASVCGRVLHTRGVTCSEPNCTVSSIATSKLMMRPVVLSRPAKIAVGWRIGSARRRPKAAPQRRRAPGRNVEERRLIDSPRRSPSAARGTELACRKSRKKGLSKDAATLSPPAARPT